MSTPSAKLSVFVGGQFACIKVAGRANFTSSVDFKTVLNELWNRGYKYFVLDLSECALMDSTFLGVLAGFGLKMNPPRKEKDPAGAIELLNPNPRITELLENLGVLHLFRLKQGANPDPVCVQEYKCETAAAGKEELLRACVEAHQTLVQINPENQPKFVDVNAFLLSELKNLKAAK
jgi:anti-sigma B factor antagonist